MNYEFLLVLSIFALAVSPVLIILAERENRRRK